MVLAIKRKMNILFQTAFGWRVSSKTSKINFADFPFKSIQDTLSDDPEFKKRKNLAERFL